MKKILISALILFLNFNVFSQDVALNENQNMVSDAKFLSKKIDKSALEGEESEWPVCEAPKDVHAILIDNKTIKVLWDGNIQSKRKYEIKYSSSFLKNIHNEYLEKNFLILPKEIMSNEMKFSVRRLCKINGETIGSEWVDIIINEQSFQNPIEPCDALTQIIKITKDPTTQDRKLCISNKWWQKIEIDVVWKIPEGPKRPGYFLTYSKKLKVLKGEIKCVTVPYNSLPVIVIHNPKIAIAGDGNETECDDIYIKIQDDGCNQTLFYTAIEDYGITTIDFQLELYSKFNGDFVNIELNDGTNQVLPVDVIGPDIEGKYIVHGQISTCMDFSINLPNTPCSPITIDNPCIASEDVKCNSLEVEIEPSIFYDLRESIIEEADTSYTQIDTIYKCIMNWEFPANLKNGKILKIGGGDNAYFSGNKGMTILSKGDYSISYEYNDSNGETQSCSTTIKVKCGDGTSLTNNKDLVEKNLSCDMVKFDVGENKYFNGRLNTCTLKWDSPDTISVMMQVGLVGSSSSFSIAANSGSYNLRNGLDYDVNYIISYNHPDSGWIYKECNGFQFQCHEDIDTDGDGIIDYEDNCPLTPNGDQADADHDGIGDVCEQDTDGDGVIDDEDNCIYIPNPDQKDDDLDGIGDVCEEINDADDDGVPDYKDNCPITPNPDQADADHDGIGDVCEQDTDGDGVIDDEDNCIYIPNPDQKDTDGDGFGDVCDNGNEDSVELDEDVLCGIFNQSVANYVDQKSFIYSNSPDIDDYLQTMGITDEYLNEQFSIISKIDVTFSFQTETGSVNGLEKTIYSESDYGEGSSFDVNNYSVYVSDNSSIQPKLIFQVKITEKSGEIHYCAEKNIPIENEVEDEEDSEIPDLPKLTCGDDFDSPASSSDVSLEKLKVGDLIFIDGFPLKVSEVTNPTTPFSGTGVLPLPFNDEVITVDFEKFIINEDYVVLNGELSAMASPSDLEDITGIEVPVLTIGDDYCVPPEKVSSKKPPTGGGSWAKKGGSFDENGIFSGTGTKYDFNGFDVNGNYYNGYPYNEYGCRADGTYYEEPHGECDPSKPYSKINDVIKDITPKLDKKIEDAINELLNKLNIDINDANCDTERQNLKTAFDEYTIDKTDQEKERLKSWIYGRDNEFLDDGLSSNFTDEPILPPADNNKDPKLANIEKYHVQLYHCDQRNSQFNKYKEALSNPEIKKKIKDYILAEISTWTEYQVKVLFDPNNDEKFDNWLKGMIENYFNENPVDGDFGYLDTQSTKGKYILKKKFKEIFDFTNSSYFATASMDNMYIDINDDDKRRAFEFEFNQGFSEVLGVNRAFFLEKIAEVNGNSGLMPLKVPAEMTGKYVDIYLDDLHISESGATIDVYAIVKLKKGKIVLQADNISFTSAGITEVTLKLKSDIELKLFNPAKITIPHDKASLRWTCGKLDNFQIEANVEICDRYIKPYDLANKKVKEGENVTFEIVASGTGWGEFYTDISVDQPFVLTNYDDWVFELKHLVLDFDSGNTPNITPAVGYESNFYDEVNRKLDPGWTGFYLDEIKVHIPEKLRKSVPIDAISLENVVFDDAGFCGKLGVEKELLTMEQGASGGWGFGISGIDLFVLRNNISGFGIHGKIHTPLFEENMEYIGSMHANHTYSLSVKAATEKDKTWTVPLLLADANLTSLAIDAVISDESDGVQLTATVSGNLTIKGQELLSVVKDFPSLEFTNLSIRNYGPEDESRIKADRWKLKFQEGKDKIKVYGFEVRMETDESGSVTIKQNYENPDDIGIPINVSIDFLEDLSIVVGGGFDIVGTLNKEKKLYSWEYDRIEMNGFCVSGGWKGVTIDPDNPICLKWYNPGDPGNVDGTYGKGFRGTGKVKFDIGAFKMEVSAICQFGKKDNNKYFFVDVLAANLPSGVVVGPLNFNGVGGGVSYNMKSTFDFESIDFSQELNDPTDEIGTTFSGGIYTPNPDFGYSFKLLTLFELLKIKDVLNGSAFLSVSFKDGGGLDNIQLAGVAKMLTDVQLNNIPVVNNVLDKVEELKLAKKGGDLMKKINEYVDKPLQTSINGYVFFEFDMGNNERSPLLTGDFKVFMNVGDGLRGAGKNDQVVNAKLRFATFTDWYINIGTPQNLCGVKFDALGALDANLYAYFDIGTTIPKFTQDHLPEAIRSFVEKNVKVSEAFRKSGGGIMFGMGLNLEMEAKLWLGHAWAKCGVGFDVMMKKTNMVCVDQGLIGANGWYAMGQLWAYIDAGLTIANKEVLNTGVYAILNAQFPNPTVVQGAVDIRIKILRWYVSKTMELKLGESCIAQNNTDGRIDIEAISFIDPMDGADYLPVAQKINTYFSIPIDEKIEAGDDVFYVHDFTYELTDEEGKKIDCFVEMNEDNTIAYISGYEFLDSEKEYSFTANVTIDLLNEDGDVIETQEQSKSTSFKTGKGFEGIPITNVKYAYPMPGMYNYYSEENAQQLSTNVNPVSSNGSNHNSEYGVSCYIALIQGQSSLFENIPENYVKKIILENSAGDKLYLSYEYNYLEKQIEFVIPVNSLDGGEVYSLSVAFVPESSYESVANNDNASGSFNFGPQKNAELNEGDKILLQYYFRVSEYKTFIEKMQNSTVTTSGTGNNQIINIDMNGGVIDDMEWNYMLESSIKSTKLENNLNTLLNPLFHFENTNFGYDFESLLKNKNSIKKMHFEGDDKSDFYIDDFSSIILDPKQKIVIDYGKNVYEKYSNTQNILYNRYTEIADEFIDVCPASYCDDYPLDIDDCDTYFGYERPFEEEVCREYRLCKVKIWENIEIVEKEHKIDFLDTYEDLKDREFEQSNGINLELKYKLPNGKLSSKYSKTY